MSRTTLKKIGSFVPLAAILTTIFYFSSQTGSTSHSLSWRFAVGSGNLLAMIFGWDRSWQEMNIVYESINSGIRILAHASEHMLLTFAFYLPLTYAFVKEKGILTKKNAPAIPFPLRVTGAVALTVGCAFLDELHQSFVYGRVADIMDVLVDSCGALVAAGIITLVHFVRKRRNR